MEKLEQLLKDATNVIAHVGEYVSKEQEEEMDKKLRQIECKLIEELCAYGIRTDDIIIVNGRKFGTIEEKLCELKAFLKDNNRESIETITENSKRSLIKNYRGMEFKLEEERTDKEEQQNIVDDNFHKTKDDIYQTKDKNNKTSQMEETIQEIYNEILNFTKFECMDAKSVYRRSGHIGRVNPNLEGSMRNVIVSSFRDCILEMSERHNISREKVTKEILKEVDKLQEDVINTVCNENEVELHNSLDSLKLTGKSLEQFNQKAEILRQEAIDSEKEQTQEKSEEVKALSTDMIH